MIELIHGNALNVMKTLPPDTFDALITDPPYASGGAALSDRQRATKAKYTSAKRESPYPDFEGDTMDQRTWMRFMADVLECARRVCKQGSPCVFFTDWRQLPALAEAMQRAGWTWRGVLVWDKIISRPQPGRFRQQAEFMLWGSNGSMPLDRPVQPLPGVFRHANVQGKDRVHQTQKPLEVMRQIVHICAPGGRILDPFAGSGSTLSAAEAEGYSAVGIEIVAGIAKLAANRLAMTQDEQGRSWFK